MDILQVTHDGGLTETLRLFTALQQWGGHINLSAFKPLELVSVGKMQGQDQWKSEVESVAPKMLTSTNMLSGNCFW